MRASASNFVKAAAERNKKRKALGKIDTLGKILKNISEFLCVPKAAISQACYALTDSGDTDYRKLMSDLGILEDVHFVSYTGEEVDLRHVLYDLPDTLVWKRFCLLASQESTHQIVLLVSLKGGVSMVLTNKAIVPYPGCFFHKVVSGNPSFNDVYLFRLEHMARFMKPEQVHNN